MSHQLSSAAHCGGHSDGVSGQRVGSATAAGVDLRNSPRKQGCNTQHPKRHTSLTLKVEISKELQLLELQCFGPDGETQTRSCAEIGLAGPASTLLGSSPPPLTERLEGRDSTRWACMEVLHPGAEKVSAPLEASKRMPQTLAMQRVTW